MTDSESKRLGRVENKITGLETQNKFILESLKRIEKKLDDGEKKFDKHVDWEEHQKYPKLEKEFVRKEYFNIVKEQVNANEKEISDMPNNLSEKFAGIWTEAWLKAVVFTIGGSIFVGLFFHMMNE